MADSPDSWMDIRTELMHARRVRRWRLSRTALVLLILIVTVSGGGAVGMTRGGASALGTTAQDRSLEVGQTRALVSTPPSPEAAGLTASSTPTSLSTPIPSLTPPPPQAYPLMEAAPQPNTIFLALGEAGYSHLYAFHPLSLPFTRLSAGLWNDVTPSLSPDGRFLAFASDRDGQWDLYLLDLGDGTVRRLTDTPSYEAAPSWSPDGQFLACESYLDENLEVVILAVDGAEAPINLSASPAADFAPAWSPQGRQIAFVSLRSGQRDIWLADLDQAGEKRFTNLSHSATAIESHPAWSPDGRALAWAKVEGGLHTLMVWRPEAPAQPIGSGDWPAWSPDGATLLTLLAEPNQALLTAYASDGSRLELPPLILPGPLEGLAWAGLVLPAPLPEAFAAAASQTPAPLWQPALAPSPQAPTGRQRLVPLHDVQAPYPQLHDMVDESFEALRARVAQSAGWDLLATLENAFVPLTEALAPGMSSDWLYTGRAFAFTPLPLNAGWLAALPEEFGSQTYWHIYMRARFQDGSQGRPLHDLPWDFNARYSGDPQTYESGGAPAQTAAPGYWLDFTTLAQAYGWERLPALSTWRSAYMAARFNEFALTNGMDWRTAMLELYPPEALVTPTIVLPPSPTPTSTSRWYRTPTPSRTPTPRPTFTPRFPSPTISPSPSVTPLPTATLSPTAIPSPTPGPSTATPRATASKVSDS
jgi:TolB protein